MNIRTRRIGRGVLAAGLAAVVAATLSAPTAAQARRTLAPSIVSARNSGDPAVTVCHVPSGPNNYHRYLCMFTSSDLNVPGGTQDYPMDATYLYTMDLAPGTNLNPGNPASWVDRGAVLTESDYQMWVTKGTQHIWAPAGATGPDGRMYLYVPSTPDKDTNVSHIGVSSASNPFDTFTYRGQIQYQGKNIANYYMSDPAIAVTGWNHPGDPDPEDGIDEALEARRGGPATWLLWANGDYANNSSACGGLSIGLLDDKTMTRLLTDPNPDRTKNPTWGDIRINGIGAALGTCQGLDRPYLEGPELYDLTQVGLPLPGGNREYVLFFSAKPEGGSHGISNQVLAWATASEITGPYTYEGILMDASDTSWTNHGSLYAETTVDAEGKTAVRFIIFFHDTDSESHGNHNRRAHAACLVYDKNTRKFQVASRPATLPQLRSLSGCPVTTIG